MLENPTRQTLDRAKYHLSEMKKTFQDDSVFSFNLSSFVQAARSITFHMKKQYGKMEGFQNWYDKLKEPEMRNNPELRFLIKARNYAEKQGPLPTGATRSVGYGMDMILVREGSKPEIVESEITKVVLSSLEPTELQPPEPKTLGRWFWDVTRYLNEGDKIHAPEFERSDVIKTCENIIEYLDKLVDDCEAKFS